MENSGRRAIGGAVIGVAVAVLVAVAATAVYTIDADTAPPNYSACGPGRSTAPNAVQVSIYSGSSNSANPPGYTPDKITLVIGVNNTVTWTNNDSVHHTVTTTSAPASASFNSGNMNAGESCTHTFTVPGTYQYDCAYHVWMTGTIVVRAAE